MSPFPCRCCRPVLRQDGTPELKKEQARHQQSMQLIQLEREDWNFFCPSTGQSVFNDTGEPNASTVRAVWCHEVPDEPELLCTELQAQWAAHLAIQDAADEAVDVVAFLNSVDHPGWVAFEITTSGFACGPVSSTTWTVLDLS